MNYSKIFYRKLCKSEDIFKGTKEKKNHPPGIPVLEENTSKNWRYGNVLLAVME